MKYLSRIVHFFLLIANEIRVILSERVKGLVKDPAIDTSYFLNSYLTNGRSYWVDSAKKFAIFWTSSEKWLLAPYDKLGLDEQNLLYNAQGKDSLPFHITKGWHFLDKNEKSWKSGSKDEIVVAKVHGNILVFVQIFL